MGLFFFFEVPGDCLFEPLVEVGFWLVAEFGAGARNVCQRVLDIALPGWAVVRLGGESDLSGDGGVDLVEGMAFSGADVEDAASGNCAVLRVPLVKIPAGKAGI